MRRTATSDEKKAWMKAFGCHLVGFVPCIGGNPKNVVHWSAIERHWNGDKCTRLCDFIGAWTPAPRMTVNCMTCLTRATNVFIEEPMKETLNETIEKHVLAKLATLPKDKNAKLREITDHVLYVAKVKDVNEAKTYDAVSGVLGRLKQAAKVRYIGGKGCGWRLP